MTNEQKQNKARIKNNLQMPLIIRDLMITGLRLENDVQYSLHELMSNMQPQDALLCAAFTTEEIVDIEDITSTDLTFLKEEYTRIITRYTGANHIDSEKDKIHTLIEDIEGFLDTMSLCHMSFEITNPKAAKFFDIIITQLQAHLVITDEIIAMMEQENITPMPIPPAHVISGISASNVIPFPR